jgi:hypothetical protein
VEGGMHRRCRTLEDTRMIIGTLRDYHTGRDPGPACAGICHLILTGLQKSEQKKRRARTRKTPN